MSGSGKPKKPRIVLQVERRMKDLMIDKSFLEEVDHLRLYDDQEIRFRGMLGVLESYDIPWAGALVMWHFLETGKLEVERTSPTVELVSEAENTVEPNINPKLRKYFFDRESTPHVFLSLSQEATLGDIEAFLREHGDLVKSKLKKSKIVRTQLLKERDERIFNKHQAGITAKQIATEEEPEITQEIVWQIIRRQKERKKKPRHLNTEL